MNFLVLGLLVWAMSSLGLAAPGQNIRSVNSTSPNSTALNPDSNNSSSTGLVPTHEFNVCDGKDAFPKYYKDYGMDKCPPRYIVGGDGHCQNWDKLWQWYDDGGPWDCGTFCQQSTIFVRGPESPYPRSECHYPLQCSLTESMTSSWNWSISFDIKVQYILEAGVSGSFGHTWGHTKGITWTIPSLAPGDCGYFTFIPTMKITRGVMTDADREGTFWSSCENPRSTPFEAKESWQREDSQVGVNIFVYTDCVTMEPLPMDRQDEIYRQPGVALPRAAVASMMKSWVEIDCEYQAWGPQDTTTLTIHGKGIQLPNEGAALRDQLKLCGAKVDTDCGGWIWYEWNEDDELLVKGGKRYWWRAFDCFTSTPDMGCVVDAIKKNGGPADTTCTKRPWKKIAAQQPANVTASNVTASNVTASKMVESSPI